MLTRVIKKGESVVYDGKIYSFGDDFEVDNAIGKSLIERGYVTEIGGSANPSEEEIIDVDYEEVAESNEVKDVSEMSYPELKAYASELGISASGKKTELIERINEALATDELPDTSMPE